MRLMRCEDVLALMEIAKIRLLRGFSNIRGGAPIEVLKQYIESQGER